MSDAPDNAEKIHYICQTYVETKGARGARAGLKSTNSFNTPAKLTLKIAQNAKASLRAVRAQMPI